MTNRELVESVFAALAHGDPRPLLSSMRDDCTWTIAGTASWARAYEGRQAIVEELFARLTSRVAPPIRIVPDRIVDCGDTVVVQAHGANTTQEGEPLENSYCFVIEVVDAKLAALTEYTDTALVERVLGP